MKKNTIVLLSTLAFLLVILIVLGVTFASLAGANFGSEREKKVEYDCKVKIRDAVFSNPISPRAVIDTATCQRTTDTCGSILPFASFFDREGIVEIWDSDGRQASAKFDTDDSAAGAVFGVLVPGTDTVSLKACSDGDGLEARIYDIDGNLFDAEDAEVIP